MTVIIEISIVVLYLISPIGHVIPISHYGSTAQWRTEIGVNLNLFTLTSLTAKQNIYYQRL